MASLPGLDAYASDSSGSEMDEVEARQDDTTGPGDDAGEVLKQVELEMAEAGVIRAGDLSASAGGAAAESDSSSSSESDSDDEVIGAAMASINRDAIADDEVTDAGSLIPPRSRHEIEPPPAQPLPENLNVDVASLQPIGSVLSKVLSEGTVVVKGMSGVPPLDEDSLLCTKGVADTPRVFPLGRVHELFGPVTLPHYIVKCPEQGVLASLSLGDTVYSVQGMSSYLRPEAILGGKGCDASNMHDEEVRQDEVEYSDDEQEREAKLRHRSKDRRSRPQQSAGQPHTTVYAPWQAPVAPRLQQQQGVVGHTQAPMPPSFAAPHFPYAYYGQGSTTSPLPASTPYHQHNLVPNREEQGSGADGQAPASHGGRTT